MFDTEITVVNKQQDIDLKPLEASIGRVSDGIDKIYNKSSNKFIIKSDKFPNIRSVLNEKIEYHKNILAELDRNDDEIQSAYDDCRSKMGQTYRGPTMETKKLIECFEQYCNIKTHTIITEHEVPVDGWFDWLFGTKYETKTTECVNTDISINVDKLLSEHDLEIFDYVIDPHISINEWAANTKKKFAKHHKIESGGRGMIDPYNCMIDPFYYGYGYKKEECSGMLFSVKHEFVINEKAVYILFCTPLQLDDTIKYYINDLMRDQINKYTNDNFKSTYNTRHNSDNSVNKIDKLIGLFDENLDYVELDDKQYKKLKEFI